MAFTWTEKLRIGIPEIDQQHKKLINMTNDFYLTMKSGQSQDILLDMIDELSAYAQEHFITEEGWQNSYEFPDRETHQQQHKEFIKKINTFREQFIQGQVGVSIQMALFISNWITAHLSGIDLEYAQYFKDKGITNCRDAQSCASTNDL